MGEGRSPVGYSGLAAAAPDRRTTDSYRSVFRAEYSGKSIKECRFPTA